MDNHTDVRRRHSGYSIEPVAVEFTATVTEHRDASRRWYLNSTTLELRRALPLIGFALVIAFVGRELAGWSYGTMRIVVPLVVLLNIGKKSLTSFWRYWQDSERIETGVDAWRKRTYEFLPEGFQTNAPTSDGFVQWADVSKVVRTKEYLLIFHLPSRVHYVPLRVFSSAYERERVCRFIEVARVKMWTVV